MELSIDHYRKLWTTTNEQLESHCKEFEEFGEDDSVPEDVQGEIRTAIGLAKLLKGQKLKQFSGLIDDSEFKTGEIEVNLMDLQGFWDMVYTEVEKINNCFKKLEDCRKNGWKLEEESVENVKPKKAVKKAPPKGTDKSSSLSQAAKQRLAEAKKKMKAQQQATSDALSENLLSENTASSDGVTEDAPCPKKMTKNEPATEVAPSKLSKKAPKRSTKVNARDPLSTDLLSTESASLDKSLEDAPSPKKMAKKENANEVTASKPSKKASKRNTKSNARDPLPKDLLSTESASFNKNPEDAPSPKKMSKKENAYEVTASKPSKKASKRNAKVNAKDLQPKDLQSSEFDQRRITRSVRRAMLELQATHNA